MNGALGFSYEPNEQFLKRGVELSLPNWLCRPKFVHDFVCGNAVVDQPLHVLELQKKLSVLDFQRLHMPNQFREGQLLRLCEGVLVLDEQ